MSHSTQMNLLCDKQLANIPFSDIKHPIPMHQGGGGGGSTKFIRSVTPNKKRRGGGGKGHIAWHIQGSFCKRHITEAHLLVTIIFIIYPSLWWTPGAALLSHSFLFWGCSRALIFASSTKLTDTALSQHHFSITNGSRH